MKPTPSLLNRIHHMSMNCDHLCIIGYITMGNKSTLINSDFVFNGDNADFVSLFNFCPGCGQELNIETEQKFVEKITFKENK